MTDLVIYELTAGEYSTVPKRATGGSAGYDVSACLKDSHGTPRRIAMRSPENQAWSWIAKTDQLLERAWLGLPPGWRAQIPLGFKATLPEYLEAQLRPRSGLAWKLGITLANSPGTVDSDFPDEWCAILWNTSDVAYEIVHGERIAQLVIAQYECPPWREGTVGVTTARKGGYGSTGK